MTEATSPEQRENNNPIADLIIIALERVQNGEIGMNGQGEPTRTKRLFDTTTKRFFTITDNNYLNTEKGYSAKTPLEENPLIAGLFIEIHNFDNTQPNDEENVRKIQLPRDPKFADLRVIQMNDPDIEELVTQITRAEEYLFK